MSVENKQRQELNRFTPDDGILQRLDGYINIARGATVPSDATAGYAVGCQFTHTDGGAGDTLYINEGTAASCDFNSVI